MSTHMILRGIGGSTAHGLATPESDLDTIGVYAWPTGAFWGMGTPPESLTGHEPDYTYHEVAKFIRLASKANPTVLELLFLDSYEVMEPVWGQRLIDLRPHLLATRHVHNAYLGYAEAQFRKLIQRGDSFSASTKQRTNKHARHIFRLLEQGSDLMQTGTLTVKVKDPEFYHSVNDMTVDQVKDLYMKKWGDFISVDSVLPEEPDLEAINDFMYAYREAHI